MQMFNYDWFHGAPCQQQEEQARKRCVLRRFPKLEWSAVKDNEEAQKFRDKLESRLLIYLRDGFSYEVKELVVVDSKSHLVFECEPVDDQYKVGAFVVTVPFEEIVRVEMFAVHPSEKPDDMPQITGFRHFQEGADPKAPPPPRSS